MTNAHYTSEQLLHLRQSPLVRKPDGLPSIEQWIDVALDQSHRKTKSQGNRVEEQVPGQESSQRPSLFQSRHPSRGSNTVPEGIVLGPPKISFASASRNLNKTSGPTDRPSQTSQEEESVAGERSSIREKFFKERDNDRKREKAVPHGRRAGREDGEVWTSMRPRKAAGQDQADDDVKDGDNTQDGAGEESRAEVNTETGTRSNGAARSRLEHTWHRGDSSRDQNMNRGATGGAGWRDKERRDDREWSRATRSEQDPEWMDTGAKDDTKKVHTQEEFQRWKERMKAGGAAATGEKSGSTTDSVRVSKDTSTSIPPTPLAMEGGFDKMIGLWGENKKSETNTDASQVAKAQGQRSKSSRFAGFFAPQEDLPRTAPTIPPAVPAPTEANGTNEDKEGFQRILQMLGGANNAPLNMVAPPSTNHLNQGTVNGMHSARPAPDILSPNPERHYGRVDLAFRDKERPEENQNTSLNTFSAASEQAGEASNLHERDHMASRENSGPQQNQALRQMAVPSHDDRFHQTTQRSGDSSQSINVQSLLGQHLPAGNKPVSRDTEFLFNLMHQSHPNPPLLPLQGQSRQLGEGGAAPLLSEGNQFHPQPTKPRAPPPGFYDRSYAENEMQLRERQGAPDQLKKFPPHGPPGFFDELPMAGMQRRNTDNAPRHQMGIPQQQNIDQQYMELHQNPHQHDRIAPPPGFGAAIRQTAPFLPQNLPFPADPNPNGHPGIQRGLTGPAGLFQHQMPPGPPPLFPPPNLPLVFPPGGPQPEHLHGFGHPQPGLGQRRMQFDGFGDVQHGSRLGRGGANGQYGS